LPLPLFLVLIILAMRNVLLLPGELEKSAEPCKPAAPVKPPPPSKQKGKKESKAAAAPAVQAHQAAAAPAASSPKPSPPILKQVAPPPVPVPKRVEPVPKPAKPELKSAASSAAIVGPPVWIFCAPQWQECVCPGKVRWGSRKKWLEIPLKDGAEEVRVKCSIDMLEDIAPGDDDKHCECAIPPGSELYQRVNPGLLPVDAAAKSEDQLVSSCEIFEREAGGQPWAKSLWDAVETLCAPGKASLREAGAKALKESTIRATLRAWVDPRFEKNYKKYFDENGWIEYAFLNHYAGTPGSRFTRETEELIRSVHLFSTKPIVVVSFGMTTPPQWNPERYERLVLLHAAPFPPEPFRSFHFNKLRAMLMIRARVAVQLDSDQFVAPGVDILFKRTEEEITKEYPLPILPVHFLDRNPKDDLSIGNRVKYWHRVCPEGGRKCSRQTLRWGHAHPTWTHWALPFVGRWLRSNLRDETLPPLDGVKALRVLDVPEDEDLLNVAMWEEGASKQWCKFDVPGPGDFDGWLAHREGMDITADNRFHVIGAPKVFYTAHGATKPDESAVYIDRIEEKHNDGSLPPPIVFKGKFYKTGEELRKQHPKLKCLI